MTWTPKAYFRKRIGNRVKQTASIFIQPDSAPDNQVCVLLHARLEEIAILKYGWEGVIL